MQVKNLSFEEVEAYYHGEEVPATKEQVERVLGSPSIEYGPDSENKSRTEWDRSVDGVPVKVFDHHHYGPETGLIDWSIEAGEGSETLKKTVHNEYVATYGPTPTEREIASKIVGK